MERTRRSNPGTGMDRLETSFDGKSFVHGKYCQLLTTKEKYDTIKDIDKYMSLVHDFMFKYISGKMGIKQSG